MKMENIAWRAKAVAIVDIVMLVIDGGASIHHTVILYDGDDHGLMLYLVIVLIAIQMCAAFTLLSATKLGNETKLAYDRARIWTIVVGIMAFLSVVGHVMELNVIGVVVLVLWRGVGFWVVLKFMTELELATLEDPEVHELEHVNGMREATALSPAG